MGTRDVKVIRWVEKVITWAEKVITWAEDWGHAGPASFEVLAGVWAVITDPTDGSEATLGAY